MRDPIQLKNNVITYDPRLDRIEQFDERSRNFPIRELLPPKNPRSYTWSCYAYLDQGSEGACVGFSWSHELAARPKVVLSMNNAGARALYKEAQLHDEWPGENYSGTSVIAAAKVLKSRGKILEYRWGFGLDDALMALSYKGPGVAGLNWYEGMMQPDSRGFIHPTGSVVGGHAIMINGISVTKKRVALRNSWGSDWGFGGNCYMSFEDFGRLLAEQGEFCIPVIRST